MESQKGLLEESSERSRQGLRESIENNRVNGCQWELTESRIMFLSVLLKLLQMMVLSLCGDAQLPVTARTHDMTSLDLICHKCDLLLKQCNYATTTPFSTIIFV